ncbi:hypothetical protein A7A08_02703 [Methyloligella halotolerans]|uniref:DUF3617 domain-containing protein n=1 Tax=Methyloligella halotolerans TaxID=1177755 RepID=A0A1E2RW03_9HYPH|nr:DUF3617 domain-containing protein [Methyloligella halotolerans]ODA66305.1 hypothetical protein A7A08_02703 [Methyloligella halotolerans]
MHRFWLATVALLALGALSHPAYAEGRAGLWEQTTTMTFGGEGMPKMPAIPADKMAQLKAMGIQIPDLSKPQTTTIKTCLTEEEIANRKLPKPEDMGDCTMENRQLSEDRMSADLVCRGEIQGTGHLEYVFDSETHYTGSMTFKGARGGRPIEMSHSSEGTWLAEDCGDVE